MKKEWRRAGRATGRLGCRLLLPAIELDIEGSGRDKHAAAHIRRFLRAHLPAPAEAMVGGSFVISAEMRSPGLGVRWRPLCRWKAGEPLDAVVERAQKLWAAMPKEEWPGGYETRLELHKRR